MTHRMKRLLAAAAGTAAILTPAGIALTAGAASASTPGDGAAAGATSQIVLGNGGYAYCLNDYGQQATGKVVLWSCGNYSSNNWVFYSDGTIRPELHPGSALSVSSSGDAVLTAVGTAPTAAQEWSYRADGALVNATPTGTPAAKETVLNDPGYVAKDGVQLISYSQAAPVTPNSHWWVKGAHYATTKLTDLPDAGLNGGFWALDTGTYAQSIVYTGTTGTSSSPAYTYEDSQMQAAGFTTMPGTPQPNGASKSDLIGDVLTGTMSGWYTSTLTSDHYVSAAPPPSAAGMSAWAALTPAGFFAKGTTVTPGNKSGYFTYTSATDNCGSTESMTQADTNGKPDNSTGWAGTGNIPAYAPAGANYAGGQTCPSS